MPIGSGGRADSENARGRGAPLTLLQTETVARRGATAACWRLAGRLRYPSRRRTPLASGAIHREIRIVLRPHRLRALVAASSPSRAARSPGARPPTSPIGLGTDVTAIDPHYHNVTPNNNVAAHIFGYLVQRNEKSQLEPGLATEWKTIDPLTWEFKLRKRRQVPRRQRLHRGRRRRVDRARADGAEQPVAVHRVHEADQGNDRRRSATRSASRPRRPIR